MQVNRCRCGAAPKIASANLGATEPAYAIHCENFCGDDSHWQMSLSEAVERWNAGLVRGASGGNGSAEQDFRNSTVN
jgi:hypothetical protein